MSNYSINELLKISFSEKAFINGAHLAILPKHEQMIHEAGDVLDQITQRVEGYEDRAPSEESVDRAVRKFMGAYKNEQALTSNFSKREARLLAFALHKLNKTEYINPLIYLFSNKWSNVILTGLLHYFLANWERISYKNMRPLIKFYETKLNEYEGKRKRYLHMRHCSKYLEFNGPQILGAQLRKIDNENKNFECSHILNIEKYLGVSGVNTNYPYFSKVIVTYFERGLDKQEINITKVLNKYNNKITCKRLIPQLVLYTDENNRSDMQENVKALATSYIGSPSIKSDWSFIEGDKEEQENLEKARSIVNKWILEKFIVVFFDMINEEERKQYWLSKIDIIDNLIIYMPSFMKSRLSLLNPDLKKSIDNYVYNITKRTTQDDCALVFDIRNYRIFEFSNTGGIYVKKKINSLGKPHILKQSIHSVADLKGPNPLSQPQLVVLDGEYIVQFNEEGRMRHQGYWQYRMNRWLLSVAQNVEINNIYDEYEQWNE